MKHACKSIRIAIYFAFFISALSNKTEARPGSIKGTITDYITGAGVADVKISLGEGNFSAVTDTDGRFFIASVPANTYPIFIGKTGYLEKKFSITVNSSDTLTLTLTLTPTVIDLPAMIVVSEKPLSAASSSIINKLDFELRPKNSAQDMLRLVPGLFIAQHAGGGKAEQIFVRGFDCDHGTDIATYVDGLPVNMPSHGHGQGYADLHFLIPEVVQNMQVYKGPYWAQFGDFATGAAVQFNTLDRLDKNQFTLEASTVPTQRAFAGTRALMMLQLPINDDHVSSYIAGDFLFNHGYFDVDQKFGRFTLFSKTTFQLNDHSSIMFSFNGFGSSWNASGQIPERAVADGIIDRFGSIDTTEGGTTSRNNFNLIYSSKSRGNDFMSQVYFGNYRFKLFSNFTFFLNDPVHGDEIEQDDARTFLGYNGSYSIPGKLWGMNIKTTFGAGFRADNIENQLWHAEARVRLNPEEHANVYERNMLGYVKEEWMPNEQWHIEGALRENYFTYDVEDLLPTDSSHTNYTGYNYQFLPTPKLNIAFYPSNDLSFFFNSGLGFHSNDARVVVQDLNNHRLPRALGAEVGTQIRLDNRFIFSFAFWGMDLSDELVYSGDDGTTEDNGPSRRMGIDFGMRMQITKWLILDDDVNFAHNYLLNSFLGSELPTDNLIPLAPTLTSTGGLTARLENGFEASLRYRYMHDRPANESNTVIAHGYTVVDAVADYHTSKYKVGNSIENLLNTKWNEAQFDTESRLFDEPAPVDELHFTAGTPFAAKLSATVYF